MLGATKLSILALLLAPAVLADSHGKGKKRHNVQRAEIDVPAYSNATSEHTLAKRSFSGRGTFYYTGLGACGQYSSDSDYMVALNSAQYGSGYPGPQCFKWITVQANGVTVGGVQILDECPTCDYGSLDLSPGLFKRFADESAGVISITWWFDGDSAATSTTPTSTYVAPTSTWVAPTSTYTPPASTTPTSTWVAPTSSSTYVAPSPSTTSSAAAASSTISSAAFSSGSASLLSASAGVNSTNPFAIVSNNSNGTSTSLNPSASASAGSSSDGSSGVIQQATEGNLAAINGLVAQYGQLIVVGAGGYQ